ncbi:hypothetical protein L202_08328 [Cryptococcus amylolentus CBS 6039]|uniref:diphosphoinositol-polyphosphate diphosphatase n=2 Tax=Cryptococcus amylolentus TaxID=104669 RepID=A0A1E3H980_9TREE|nr:hypothetical protein L202_08328 [Cryptococcus amylolentus CBS 6039]ODN72912.1 hypothetical protein L202_08328 [Cryptococcus amylolentus CBS 6039]ODN98090.1 hypothetical protein I350_07732 [Cryptococcus amylolentus CBS 6273]
MPPSPALQAGPSVPGPQTAPPATAQIPPFLANIIHSHIYSAAPSVPPPSGSPLPPHGKGQVASPTIFEGAKGQTTASGQGTGVATSPPTLIAQHPPPNALYLPPPAMPAPEEDLVPPENFSLVSSGVYRCGFPKKRNFKFMETLRLKTVLTLVLEEYPKANLEWCQSQDIQFMQFGIPGNKEPFDNIPEDVICAALVAICDKRNHPLLIHCNKGKHRTGCLIGCIRRLQSWSRTSIFDEYRRFSAPKSRAVDQQFIDLFDIGPVWEGIVGGGKGGGLGNLPEWGMLGLPKGIVEVGKDGREKKKIERDTLHMRGL